MEFYSTLDYSDAMSRQAGSPKTGGRKKGTPNKRTLGLQQALEANGIIVIDELTKLLPNLDNNKRADVLLNLMTFLFPKRKAIEVLDSNPEADNEIIIQFVSPKSPE